MADSDIFLFIPVAASDETVAVPVDDLPEEAEDLLDVLKAEEAPLSLWIDFAKAYLAQVTVVLLFVVRAVRKSSQRNSSNVEWCMQGQLKQYLHILKEGTSEEVAEYFQHAKFERLQLYCALAAYYTAEGRKQQERNARTEHFAKAAQLLGLARQIDYEDQLPFLGLGQLELARVRDPYESCRCFLDSARSCLCWTERLNNSCRRMTWPAMLPQGNLQAAKQNFVSAAEAKCNGRTNIGGVLALAGVHFQQGQYGAALGLYRRALREHPGAPAEVRLGLAACHFRLGQFNQARAVYERTLELDPACGEALLGLAVLAFNSKDTEK